MNPVATVICSALFHFWLIYCGNINNFINRPVTICKTYSKYQMIFTIQIQLLDQKYYTNNNS